jgi:anti-sigma B factor antagonist
MKLEERRYADTLVLRPAGRLDHDSCETFQKDLQSYMNGALPGRPIVLDLSGLDYVSSAGLRLLMLAGKQAAAQGGRILIAAMRPLVAEISRFTMLFEIYPGVHEALTAASPSAAAAYDGR